MLRLGKSVQHIWYNLHDESTPCARCVITEQRCTTCFRHLTKQKYVKYAKIANCAITMKRLWLTQYGFHSVSLLSMHLKYVTFLMNIYSQCISSWSIYPNYRKASNLSHAIFMAKVSLCTWRFQWTKCIVMNLANFI